MKKSFLFIFACLVLIILAGIACNQPGGGDGNGDDGSTPLIAVNFISVEQTGGISSFTDSTGLTLTFDTDPTTLTASFITVTGAIRGELSGTGTTRNLEISDISVGNGETVSVSITSPLGYSINDSQKAAVVFKDIMPGVLYRDLIPVPGGTYTQSQSSTNNFSHTVSDFFLGKYEITYELWYTVYCWATINGYIFQNAGVEGNSGVTGAAPSEEKYEPVTFINWRDAIVWCNAYSEMSGLTPCYSYSSVIIKDSRDSNDTTCDNTLCNWSANGYRLSSEGEWQYAASYIDGSNWLPRYHASGDESSYCYPDNSGTSTVFGNYAWYDGNSNNKTHNVGEKLPNTLNIYDMSGNVIEWCWDWHDSFYPDATTDYRGPATGLRRQRRGGCWGADAGFLMVSSRAHWEPYDENELTGFRIARSTP